MKRIFLLILILFIFVSGCSQNTVNYPYEIVKDTSVISYFDSKQDIDVANFNIVELSPDHITDMIDMSNLNENRIMVDGDIIRHIYIVDRDVITYKQISVGDSIDKIEDAFEYEDKVHDVYKVVFNGDTEEKVTNQNKEDDWIWIAYYTDGSEITQIMIYDAKFAQGFI